MRIPKIYLETTIFNYYFDEERDAHPYVLKLFEEIAEGKYIPYTSTYVLEELEQAPEEKRGKMLALIDKHNIETLTLSERAEHLAENYIKNGIMTGKSLTDAIHIAVATVFDMDMILSLNFRHIVKKKTIELTALINASEGYHKVQIYNPMEVVDYEEPE